ncbi:Uncharacterized protein APZ42_007494 [Daphnia magna]|uniref:Uncharacterized protein n=1 Tax=Daphnia magna TaxID=35525 RepID=A0A164F8Z4_9CRUS|nr:Uncharacterized protein APZ42_007494 [Daphnia magna]
MRHLILVKITILMSCGFTWNLAYVFHFVLYNFKVNSYLVEGTMALTNS